MSWAEERRANRAAAAEQARLDAAAETERRIRERAAHMELSRVDSEARAEQARAAKADRRVARSARWAGVRRFLAAHRVGLLVYPLAVASAVMAIPSMAAFGMRVYGNATGAVLPVLSELGMWAFAFAVEIRRRRSPEAPLWALQVGVWTFAAVGFAINAMHGAEAGFSHAVVMGMASVAGVVAHQLVTASAARSRVDRAAARRDRRRDRKAARLGRREDCKLARVARAAMRQAAAEIDGQGRTRLVFRPGRYVLGRHGRLVEALDSPSSAPELGLADRLGDEVAAWLATQDRPGRADRDGREDRGPVATLDRPTEPPADSGRGQRKSRRKNRGRRSIPSPKTRSMTELRSELGERLAVDPGSVDVGSAESIRRALRCSPERARQLRDEHKEDGQ